MFRTIRHLFAIMVTAPLFLGLTWFFGIYLHPQGSTGAGFSFVLILLSAIASLVVYRWLARPGPKVRFRNKGVDGYDRDFGLGMTGYAEHKGARRRRDDDPDPDSVGGRRNSGDGDLDGEEGLA
ncbi:MAG: hypothetical protein GYB36_04925 [Alphaproteobacteria bacterium]|nr:hypothetical protein [Alphaproteobacteria bacterium]